MIAIKNNIPYKSSSLNIATEGDTTSESQTIEIPTDNNKMLRITNLYIPPVKTTSEVSVSQRENQISMDLWPSETYDMILGDSNSHSTLWDDNLPTHHPDTRGAKIESWMSTTGMACLNTGEPTHHTKRYTPSGKGSAPIPHSYTRHY